MVFKVVEISKIDDNITSFLKMKIISRHNTGAEIFSDTRFSAELGQYYLINIQNKKDIVELNLGKSLERERDQSYWSINDHFGHNFPRFFVETAAYISRPCVGVHAFCFIRNDKTSISRPIIFIEVLLGRLRLPKHEFVGTN